MNPSKTRIYAGIISIILLVLSKSIFSLIASSAFFNNHSVEVTFLFIFSYPILLLFIWTGLGKIAGIILGFISIFFTYIYLSFINIDEAFIIFYLCPILLVFFIGYRVSNKFFRIQQESSVVTERLKENINLIKDELSKDTFEIDNLDNRMSRFLNLSHVIKSISRSLDLNQTVKIIADSCYSIVEKGERVLFYIADRKKQTLELIYSKKTSHSPYVKIKNGDIFDRWVLKKRQPLLVEDIKKDFRFSLESAEINKSFNSLISAPLSDKDAVLGTIRIDSINAQAFTQEDLRLLRIVSDLASAALQNSILYKKVSELATRDSLTDLYVHKYFKEQLEHEVKRTMKNKKDFALAIMDIDDFKEYNDKYGHTAGDLVLKHIAEMLKKLTGGGDVAARYGGEEFSLILVNKKKQDVYRECEKLRKKIENTPMVLRREKTKLSISVGIASCPKDSTSQEELLRIADSRLYKAKAKGKNCVCMD